MIRSDYHGREHADLNSYLLEHLILFMWNEIVSGQTGFILCGYSQSTFVGMMCKRTYMMEANQRNHMLMAVGRVG